MTDTRFNPVFLGVARRLALVACLLASVSASAQTSSAPLASPEPVDTVAALSTIPAPVLAARAWFSVDMTSDQVVVASAPDTQVEPASLTKIMTAYVVFNALKESRLTLDQQVPVSEAAWRTGGSRMFIEPRKAVTVHELLQGMIVQSGNDAAVALAETVAGSETAFATLMNQEAQRLGMKDSHFMNATGLPDPQHITTVRDIATLAMRLIQDHPDFYHYYQQREYTYNNITQSNRNRLLWVDPSVDGMKTGHTNSAGYCLVATALRGERRVLTVLVGADSEAARAEESLKLLNWSFQNFDTVKLYDDGKPALDVKVWEGVTDVAKLGPAQGMWVTVPRGQAVQVQSVASRTDPLVAPLASGQRVGTLSLTLDGKALRTEPLVVLEAVERAGFFGRMLDTVLRWFE